MRQSIKISLLATVLIGIIGLCLTQAGAAAKVEQKRPNLPARVVAMPGSPNVGPRDGLQPDGSRVIYNLLPGGKAERIVEVPHKDFAVSPYPTQDKPVDRVERTLREAVAKSLEQAKLVPRARVAHFGWLNDAPLVFRGWLGMVDEVSVTPTGWSAKVRFAPNVRSDTGHSATVVDKFMEFYAFENGALRYVQGAGTGGGGSYLID